jgi:hypothetical protein
MRYRYDIENLKTGEIQSLEITLDQAQVDQIEKANAQGASEDTARYIVARELDRSGVVPDGFIRIGNPLLLAS